MPAMVLTVSQVNSYLKSVIDGDSRLKYIFVKGEIYDFKGFYASGHLYFTLKDEKSQINAVMYSTYASRLRFTPENGMKVIVMGRVSVYEVRGQYNLYVETMQPDGMGALAVAYEQLKAKLSAKGVFDENHKRPLPYLPQRIGVVTSPSGAVIQDIKNVVSRRCPLTEIVLYPSAVQGDGAAQQLTEGVRYFSKSGGVDVIIIGRGGGSFEDLNAFNDEALIWAIYDCPIPIISAVGHETDFTLCDFAADMRAPTPSAAAELAVPDKADMMKDLNSILDRMSTNVSDKLHAAFQDVDKLNDAVEAGNPHNYIKNELAVIRTLDSRIRQITESRLAIEHARIDAAAGSINALSPIKLLQRGYSIALKNGKSISGVSALSSGDPIDVRFADGMAHCTVVNTKMTGE